MRGGNTTGLRAYNERLVIDAIINAGPLSKAEIARATGLSGQAASVIVTHLLSEGLVERGEKIRGQIGQPSTPIGINPRGAFALGIGIGRRGTEAILIDFTGGIVAERRARHSVPKPEATLRTASGFAHELLNELDDEARGRVVGLGIAMPGDLHAWTDELGLDAEVLAGWKDIDIASALAVETGLEAVVLNDAAAACLAEMTLGDGIAGASALYLFFGAFIGAGIVLDGKLYRGSNLNAGAIGSMPTCRSGASGPPTQLIRTGSVVLLEPLLKEAGCTLRDILEDGPSPNAEAAFDSWLDRIADDVTRAAVTALCVIDFDAIVVDGLLPSAWRQRLTHRLDEEISSFDLRGLVRPQVVTGSIGSSARVKGAALLPLRARFSPDPDLLVSDRSRSEVSESLDVIEP